MLKMASKAYVASMTVAELKEELKQRGLSLKGTKRELKDRLEKVRNFYFLSWWKLLNGVQLHWCAY